jgi:hypothetical protein
MNVEIGAEAALLPEKEYINGIVVAVRLVEGMGKACSKRVFCHTDFQEFHLGPKYRL